VAGRTPHEAVTTFLEPLSQAVSCITNSVINVRGGYYASAEPHPLTLNDGAPVYIGDDLRLVVGLRYLVKQHTDASHLWHAGVVAYIYTVTDTMQREIISYQWHSTGPSPITFPHLHLGVGSRVGHDRVRQAHFPTEHVTLQSFLHLLITDFEVAPRRADWRMVLTQTSTDFTWY
jgi:hypothetical protein